MNELSESDINQKAATLFLQTLKSASRDGHVRLESNSLLSAMVSPFLTLRQYYSYLILMQKIIDAYERHICVKIGFGQGNSSFNIIEDIETIGVIPVNDALTKPYSLPSDKFSMSFALGFMYVMEGSKLGGKIIFKNIQRNFGFSEIHGAKFISDAGSDTIEHWKKFLNSFSNYIVENNTEKEAIKGAQYAFESIYDFFEVNHLFYED